MSTANTDTRIRARTRTYELLLLMQTLAVLIVLWSIEPIYHAIMLNPGHQIRVLPESAIPLVAALIPSPMRLLVPAAARSRRNVPA
jgi:hypothetical protein